LKGVVKMRRYAILTILIFTLIIPYSLAAIQPLLVGEGTRIIVNIVNQQPDPVAPGEKLDLRFKVENNASTTATAVQFKIQEDYPFTVLSDNLRSLGSIGAQQYGDDGVITKFILKIAEDAPDGEYDITVAYKMSGGVWVTTEISGINVQSTEPIIGVKSITLTPKTMAQGSPGKLSIVLKNYATSAMTDITADLQLKGTKFSPLDSTDVHILERLQGKQEQQLTYTLVPDPDAASKVHSLSLILTYKDSLGKLHERNHTIGIPVLSEPSYDLNVEDVTVYTADSSGEVVLSISNTGPSEIKFLVIELMDTDQYQVLSSPKAYVGNLESDDFETASFDVHVNKGVATTVPLSVKLTYKDDYNEAYEDLKQASFKIHSKSEAQKYGLIPSANPTMRIVQFAIQVILLVFAVFMLIDVIKRPMSSYKKILWAIIVLTIAGAFLYYYFLGRKKSVKE